MGISNAGLIRAKQWSLLIRNLPFGDTSFKLRSLKDAKSLRAIVNRENIVQDQLTYQMKENDLAIVIMKKRRE